MKSILFGGVFVFAILVFAKMCAVNKVDLAVEIGSIGFTCAVLGATLTIAGRIGNTKNYVNYLKKRIELEGKMRGMDGPRKKAEEVKLLEDQPDWYGKYGGGKDWWLAKFKKMTPEELDKIGEDKGIKKLRERIRAIEEQLPFYSRLLLGSGLVLVVISFAYGAFAK